MERKRKFLNFIELFLLGSLSMTFGFSLAYPNSREKGPQDYDVCQTNDCKILAADLKSNMNSSVKPCEDFYQYACGGWIADNPIPDDEMHVYQFSKIKDSKISRISKILQDYDDKLETMTSFRKAHTVYQSCMDTGAIEKRGLKPLIDILNKNGGWPIMKPVSEWNGKFTWQKLVVNYIADGFRTLFDVIVTTEYAERTWNYFALVPIDSVVFNHAANESHYRDIIKRVISLLSPGIKKTKQMDDDIDDMIRFERDLMKVERRINVMQFSMYKILTIQEWQEMYNKQNPKNSSAIVDWLDFFNSLAKTVNKKLNKTSKIILVPFNKEKLVSLLDRTSPRTIVNYVHWKFISMMTYTTESMIAIANELGEAINTHGNSRNIKCIENLKPEHAVAYKYVTKHFQPESKNTFLKVIEEIKRQTEKNIEEVTWLKKEEKNLVRLKLDKMGTSIGYPDKYTPKIIDDYYEELVVGEHYLDNELALARFGRRVNFKELDTPFDMTEWIESPIWADACYNVPSNNMIFPALILQKPFFEPPGVPTAALYGSSGTIVAHEIIHSFDTWGSLFDEHAKFRKWWSNESYQLFDEKAECFRDQYNSYLAYEPANMTGFSDLYDYEEIADTVGAQTSFQVYKTLTKNKRDVRLPELQHISGDQLFFLTFARIHCGAEKPEYFTSGSAQQEGHDLPFLRVRGVLSNMKSFSDAFGCAPRSFLNPDKKCKLWK